MPRKVIRVSWLEWDRAYREMLTPLLERYNRARVRLRLLPANTVSEVLAQIREGATGVMMDLADYDLSEACAVVREVRDALGVAPIVMSDGLTTARCFQIAAAGGMAVVKAGAQLDPESIRDALQPIAVSRGPSIRDVAIDPLDGSYVRNRNDRECRVVKYAFAESEGNADLAARSIGMAHETYRSKLVKLGLRSSGEPKPLEVATASQHRNALHGPRSSRRRERLKVSDPLTLIGHVKERAPAGTMINAAKTPA